MNSQRNTVNFELSPSSEQRNSNSNCKIQVRPDKIVPESITVYKLKEPYGIPDHTALMCRTIFDAFKEEPVSDLDAVRLFVQAMVLVFGARVITDASLANILIKGGIKLKVAEVDNSSQENVDRKYHAMLECTVKLQLGLVSNPNVLMQAYCGVILLSAGNIERVVLSPTRWTKRSVLRLVSSMGATLDNAEVIPINLMTAKKIYQKNCLYTGLRASMVRILLGIAESGSIRGSFARTMLTFLEWAEMDHLVMVHEFLLGRYPMLLTMGHVQTSLGVLESALDYLNTLDVTERPYAKLLYDSFTHCNVLERDRFDHLVAAAHAVRRHIDPSYVGNFYRGLGKSIWNEVARQLRRLDYYGIEVLARDFVTNVRILRIIENAKNLFSGQVKGFDNLENVSISTTV